MASLDLKERGTMDSRLVALDKVIDAANKKAGKTIIGRIAESPEIQERLKITYIPTASIDVNEAMGGGFPRRRSTIIAGNPDSGKTSMCLETIGVAMQRDPEFIAGWLESEGSLNMAYLADTFGIDPKRFVYAEMDRKEGAEVALDRIEAILGTGALDILCVNSLKCLVPSEEMQKSLTESVVAVQARMNARMQRKFTHLLAEGNTAFVIITHTMTDIGSMSRDPLLISGGRAITYGASIIMDLRKRSLQESDPISSTEGMKIGASIKKNHCVCDRNPYVKTEYFVIYGQGTEQYLSTLDKAVQQNILRKAGAWIYDDAKNLSWMGKAKYREYCKDNPEYFASLVNRISGIENMDAAEIIDAKALAAAVDTAIDIKKPKKKAS